MNLISGPNIERKEGDCHTIQEGMQGVGSTLSCDFSWRDINKCLLTPGGALMAGKAMPSKSSLENLNSPGVALHEGG